MDRRGQGLRCDGVLDEREAATGFLAPGHEADPHGHQLHKLAVPRPDLPRPLRPVVALQLGCGRGAHSGISLLVKHRYAMKRYHNLEPSVNIH